MGQFTDDAEQFEDAIEIAEVLDTLRALLSQGLSGLSPGLIRAFERDDYSSALGLSRDIYSRSGPQNREAAIIYATLLTHRNLTEESAGVLRRALSVNQQDVALQFAQVENLMARERHEDAMSLLAALAQVKLPRLEMWGLMGDLYLELGQPELTITYYERALEGDLQDADVAYRLATLLFERGRRFDGAVYLERAAKIATQDARLWMLVAESWDELEEEERSLLAWSRVARLEEDDEHIWLHYGMALRHADQLHEAADALTRACALDPFLYEAQVELGHVQFEMGYMEEALQTYRKLLQERPEHVQALHGASVAAFEQGDVILAERFARQAHEHAPEWAESHYNLAIIQLELNKIPEAITCLRDATAIDPSPVNTITLAIALLRQDQGLEEARALAAIAASRCEQEEVAQELLIEFTEALIHRGHGRAARTFMDEHDSAMPGWLLLTPLLRVASYAGHEDEASEHGVFQALAAQFEEVVTEFEEVLPLEWDFDVLERTTRRLTREPRGMLLQMIHRLEG